MEFNEHVSVNKTTLQPLKGNAKKTIYMVLIDDCFDYESSITVELFENYEDALNFYNDTLSKFKEDKYSPEYDTVDEGDTFYEGYDEGWYSRDHYKIDVSPKELK